MKSSPTTLHSRAIDAMIDEMLVADPATVDEYRDGKQKAFNSLVGQVKNVAKGKADPHRPTRCST